MKFISTKGNTEPVSFSEAAFEGLAPDGGLFIPAEWPKLSGEFLSNLSEKSLQEIGLEVSKLFIDELGENELETVVGDALNFPAPLVQLEEKLFVLELFHGPTLAFKDFGARFMSRIFSALKEKRKQDIVILVATSGDTGSAVAQGFLGVEGIRVCLLYPKGKVSKIQEQQLTTTGKNVTALEIDGTFDDCQQIVKTAFSDHKLNQSIALSSANSINIARLLPQSFYYLYALAQLGDESSSPIFSVPSGNFGNITAGLMAKKMGMESSGFIAATNINDTFPQYWKTGAFSPKSSKNTISNAMDVGDPSNFARIQTMFGQSLENIKQLIWSDSFTDDQTRRGIKEIFEQFDYIADPHTAVGYEGVQQFRRENSAYFSDKDEPVIILSTAHPAKFEDVIEPLLDEKIPMPDRLQECMKGEKKSIKMNADYDALKNWLLSRYG